jgi:hypothetical protein
MDVAPFVEGGVAYDAVRPIAEAFGIYVDWNQEAQKVTLTRGARQVMMTVGATDMTIAASGVERAISIDAPPILKDGRVLLPTRLWAESFGLNVVYQPEDGGVAISEGEKTLTVVPGSRTLSLSGGSFLQLYDKDESLRFYYPQSGAVGVVWEGYVEILLAMGGEDYVIVAVNGGTGRSDTVKYALDEFDRLIYSNASTANSSVEKLPESYYGVPAYRIAGYGEGVPQAGIVFLRDGYLCGLTVEARRDANSGDVQQNTLEIVPLSEPNEMTEDEPMADYGRVLESELAVVNAILDEIIASFKAT